MLFAGIRGHDRTLDLVGRALRRGCLGQAYLFTGPEGIGKKRAAQGLARAVLCVDRPGEGCSTCESCRKVMANTHADCTVVTLAAEKKEITIDQVRELKRRLGLRALDGENKVALINDAHRLNPAAQSALLKLLEEPPGSALLILIATNPSLFSRPLLSRCQQVRFAPLPLTLVEEILVQDQGLAPEMARALAAFSQGSIGRALTLNSQIFTEERPMLLAALVEVSRASFMGLSQLAEKLLEGEDEVVARLEVLLSWYRDLLRYQLLGEPAVEQNLDQLSLLAQASTEGKIEQSLRKLTLVYNTIQALGRNANRQLALERMLLGLSSPTDPAPKMI
jgi:DNA polymerase III subunit delta'